MTEKNDITKRTVFIHEWFTMPLVENMIICPRIQEQILWNRIKTRILIQP
ncbi:MAG: hypothetical protein Q4E59_06690 [Bacteroidales bacterium]|nr:hypothetical protein [Bacteroidales bacterium]